MTGDITAPRRLEGEPQAAFAYFVRWCREVPIEARSDEAAKILGLSDPYVRRLWGRWRWKERREPLEQTINDEVTRRMIDKKAESIAEKAAEAWLNSQFARSFLAAEIGNRAVQAARRLNIDDLDANGIVRFLSNAMKDLAPRSTAEVSVSTDQEGHVSVEIAALQALPPEARVRKAREITEETARQAALLDDYYNGSHE